MIVLCKYELRVIPNKNVVRKVVFHNCAYECQRDDVK